MLWVKTKDHGDSLFIQKTKPNRRKNIKPLKWIFRVIVVFFVRVGACVSVSLRACPPTTSWPGACPRGWRTGEATLLWLVLAPVRRCLYCHCRYIHVFGGKLELGAAEAAGNNIISTLESLGRGGAFSSNPRHTNPCLYDSSLRGIGLTVERLTMC